MQDAWRAYLEVALGLTEASRKKAQQVVKDVVGKGEATAAQLQQAASELMSTSRANREALSRLVRYEVDRALGAVGLATVDEVAELSERVQDLERQQRDASVRDAPGRSASAGQAPAKQTGKQAPKKTAKKAVKKAPGKQPARTTRKTPAKKATKKAPARQAGRSGAAA